MSEGIFEEGMMEERKAGLNRKDKYRVVTEDNLKELQDKVNSILTIGNWALLGTAFETSLGFCQVMIRVTKDKTARMHIA